MVRGMTLVGDYRPRRLSFKMLLSFRVALLENSGVATQNLWGGEAQHIFSTLNVDQYIRTNKVNYHLR